MFEDGDRSGSAECDLMKLILLFSLLLSVDYKGTQDLWTDRPCGVSGQEDGVGWRDGDWYR